MYETERYEIEVLSADGEVRTSYRDLDEAAQKFYATVAENYDEPSVSVYLHDLVSSQTLASWAYNDHDSIGKVQYDSNDR